ncbi:hypothetical protein KW782_00290 [Candidatus Parcubacteria bacterium]|nr:hypothetical protein [Candidatus Parcubacteria bacterium]
MDSLPYVKEKLMKRSEDTRTYGDEHGRVIPHLFLTNSALWPPRLVEALKDQMRLTPDECKRLKLGTAQRQEFDQLVRLWHAFGGAQEAEQFIHTQSGLGAFAGD